MAPFSSLFFTNSNSPKHAKIGKPLERSCKNRFLHTRLIDLSFRSKFLVDEPCFWFKNQSKLVPKATPEVYHAPCRFRTRFWNDFGVLRGFQKPYIFVSGGLQIRVYSRLVAKSCLITFLEGFWNCFGAFSKPLEGLWGYLGRVLGASLEVFGLRWGLVETASDVLFRWRFDLCVASEKTKNIPRPLHSDLFCNIIV